MTFLPIPISIFYNLVVRKFTKDGNVLAALRLSSVILVLASTLGMISLCSMNTGEIGLRKFTKGYMVFLKMAKSEPVKARSISSSDNTK
jgi:hypothetical protein